MCLIVFAWQRHPRYRLVLAGNRDEFHERPSAPMHWWPDAPDVLAGRDLQAGGTWLALRRCGRFATVTNYREHATPQRHARSRGELVTRFLHGSATPFAFVSSLDGGDYAGFSLLVADRQSMACVSNRGDPPRRLEPGFYGLSNASLDTPWPKLTRCRDGLERLLSEDVVRPGALLELLADPRPAADEQIDAGTLPFELARAVSAPFVRAAHYGTRCTTVVLIGSDGDTRVVERRFDETGDTTGTSQFRFRAA